MKANRLTGLVVVLLALLTGCTNLPADESSEIQTSKRVELSSGGTRTLNYTPWYIHTFSISGPKGSGIGGGGPNVMPMRESGRPSGGGKESCCTSYPREWQPDLRLTVRWKADKKMDGKTLGYWYKAENVRIPQYDGSRSGGVWAIFLPGDRVKLMAADGNANGHNSVMVRPTDDDPYVVKGMLDDEWNRLYR
ncbi:DUF3304 domain-containing protein [Burkholderia multivorans]|uniref:DUF3304 domain-containing protein n=1 Tax=Burkholderia multivorans TaxID=87883 RepID=A0AB37AM49_9BURK|nr:DUF3304 domain-containing protein [Burkholderia multivorans]PRE39354.1 hypothetical protein C6P99_32220 [Burkholderia multivorans]PRE48953.1 hypothetical protein C6P97_13700 [Burkholderia multivorans]